MKRKLSTLLLLLALVACVQFVLAPGASLVGQTTQYYTGLMRRGLKANIPTLTAGEFGFATDTRELYIGSSVGNIRVHGDYITPEMYGAKGDGTTDDTAAIQAAADALTAGQMLAFAPGKTYNTKTVYIHTSNVRVGSIGGRATLTINQSTCYGILVHGGTIAAGNRTSAYFNATYVAGDYNASRVSGVTIENLKLTAYTTTKNTSIAMMWADDCRIINCETEESDGNGYDLRQCRRPIVYGCKSTSPAAYNMFVFMCSNALIKNSYFTGGVKGIELKDRYNGEPCCHAVVGNEFVGQTSACVAGGLSRLDSETSPYYIGSYEVVEDCTLEDNVFKSIANGTPPVIVPGCFASRWRVINNRFCGEGTSGTYVFQVGSSGDWHNDGKGTTGQDHIIRGNTFSNMSLAAIFDVGASCIIEGNTVDCYTRQLAQESTYRVNDTLDVRINNNVIRESLLTLLGTGILGTFTTNTRYLEVNGNIVIITPTVNSTRAFASALYSAAGFTEVVGNYIKISQGPVSHTATYGLQVAGASKVVDNYIAVDASAAKRAIDIDSGASDLAVSVIDNTMENLGDTTGATGLYAAKQIMASGNKYVGTWSANRTLVGKESALEIGDGGLIITNAASESKNLLTLTQSGSWGASELQNILWKDSSGTVAGIGAQYVSGTSTVDLVFHSLYNGGAKTESDKVAYLSGKGNFGLGGLTAFGTSATNTLALKSGTAPASSPADAYQQYSADAGAVAGQAGPHFRTEGGGIFGLRSDTGTTLQYVYQKDDLADDGTVTLPDATSGMVLVSCNAEAGMWLVQADGTVTKISGSANTDAADTDAKLCVYDGGTAAVVKNRLGAAGETRIVYYYN